MTAHRHRRSGCNPRVRAPGLPARRAVAAALRRLAVATVLRRFAVAAGLTAALATAMAVEAPPLQAQEGARFVSLKSDLANLRVGPGRRYPIDWVYKRRGLPLLVVARFDQWRWVQDHEGTKGWMHRSLLSTHRTALIVNGVQTIREAPSSDAPAVARAEAGVVADLKDCEGGWCRIALAGEEGWVPDTAIWGAVVPAP